jgi:hypothetical protein
VGPCRISNSGKTGRHVSSPSLIPLRDFGGSEPRLVAMRIYESFSQDITTKKPDNDISGEKINSMLVLVSQRYIELGDCTIASHWCWKRPILTCGCKDEEMHQTPGIELH